jgi:putative transposase
MSHSDRKALVDPAHACLSIAKQCKVLNISRSSIYYQPKEASSETLALMKRMDELFMLYPFYGSRQMTGRLRREGVSVGRHRIRRLMRLMGLQAIYKKHRTSDPHPEHKIYPYLLRKLPIKQANHVWCADITYGAPRPGLNRGAYVWNTMRKEELRVSCSML